MLRMIKTGNKLAVLFFLFISLFVAQNGIAQNVSIEATLTETNIFEGEPVQLDIAISGYKDQCE